MAKKIMKLEAWCHENSRDDLLEEWHSKKNMASRFPMKISDIEYNAPRSAYWKCEKGHEWEGAVIARTIFNRTCPVCNPEMISFPIGSKYGCLTIIGGFDVYKQEVGNKKIAQLEQDKSDFLQGIRKQNSNIDSVESFDRLIHNLDTKKYYKCQCKCGQVQYLDEFHFLEKRHRYCTSERCGLRNEKKERLLKSYKRVYDESYNIDYSNTIHESLEILECVDDNHEVLYCVQDKRKNGGGTYKIYKIYRCRCYLCGKEQNIRSSKFSINPPTDYGCRASGGYYSEAFCDCHEISSFQWIVTKILTDNNVPYRVEFSFSDLYGTKHINLLRFDFAILNDDNSIKCLIECQGEQHFKPVDEFGGESQYQIQQKNDELKRAYAAVHNISLYEIPYKKKKYENVELFLKSKGII